MSLPTTLTPARLAVVAYAKSIVGLTAPDLAFLALVAPGDAESREKQIADESDCMLVALGIQEAVFLVLPRGSYIEGSAPRLLEARAGGYPWAPGGAMRLATLESPPGPGDAVWWGKGWGGPEHVEHLVDAAAADGDDIAASMVAGGERVTEGARQGHETVVAVSRTLHWNGHQWEDPHTGRTVIAVLDCDGMARLHGLRSTT